MSLYLRKNFQKDELKERPVFFFDIDQTFGASSHSFFQLTEENHKAYCQKMTDNGLSLRYAYDTMNLSQASLALFAELLKGTNGVAICISSWTKNKNPEESMDSIQTIFSWFADFPDNWLVGQTSGVGGDRYESAISKVLNKYDVSKYVVLDDAYRAYSNQDYCVKIDGRLGFNIYNLVEAVDFLDADLSKFDESITYHIKKIREEKLVS